MMGRKVKIQQAQGKGKGPEKRKDFKRPRR
jgi:hypothetical protein